MRLSVCARECVFVWGREGARTQNPSHFTLGPEAATAHSLPVCRPFIPESAKAREKEEGGGRLTFVGVGGGQDGAVVPLHLLHLL